MTPCTLVQESGWTAEPASYLASTKMNEGSIHDATYSDKIQGTELQPARSGHQTDVGDRWPAGGR